MKATKTSSQATSLAGCAAACSWAPDLGRLQTCQAQRATHTHLGLLHTIAAGLLFRELPLSGLVLSRGSFHQARVLGQWGRIQPQRIRLVEGDQQSCNWGGSLEALGLWHPHALPPLLLPCIEEQGQQSMLRQRTQGSIPACSLHQRSLGQATSLSESLTLEAVVTPSRRPALTGFLSLRTK